MYTELQANVDWIPDSDEVFNVMLLLGAAEEEVCVPEGCVPDSKLLLGPLLLGPAEVDPELSILLGILSLEEGALSE